MAVSKVAVLADTHVPSRAPSIPGWVADLVLDADHAIHAGDIDAPATLERLRELAGGADRLTAVRGNTDPRRLDLPRVATVERGGVTFVVTHGDGPQHNYVLRVRTRAREHGGPHAVAVCGHTHEYLDEHVRGTRILNPGTATGAPPASEATMLVAAASDGDLDVTVHRP